MNKLGTEDLPEHVVVQPVRVVITMTTDRGERRKGRHKVRMKLGGRRDPHLTADEAQYVARVIERAAAVLRMNYEVPAG